MSTQENSPTPASSKRIITPEQWAEAEGAWILGKYATIGDLADDLGLPKRSVEVRFTKRKLKRGSAIADYNRKLQKEIEAKAAEDAKVLQARIEETRNEHYTAGKAIFGLVMKEIGDARKTGLPIVSAKPNIQTLEIAARALKLAREERFAVLGLDREERQSDDADELPELTVSEMTEEDVEEMRARQNPDAGEDISGIEVMSVEDAEIDLGDAE